jgi:hypothetical protein
MLNEKAIHGEKNTGYEGPEGGPFRCSNCEYFNASTDGCSQEDMKKYSARERLPSGDVEVEAGGCCEYIDRKK